MTAYCSIDDVKDRLLIATNDTSYDTALNNAVNEASVVCDMFLRAYTSVPLSSPYPDEVRYATADIASSIFKRRMMPEDVTLRGALQPDQLNQMDATGWFALGIRKLEQYIKSKYVVQDKPFTSNTVYNPEIYIDLMSKGVITPAEARQYVTGATQATVKELKDVITTLTQTINTTQTLNDTVARAENLTKTLNQTLTTTTNETLNTTRTQIQQLTDNLTKTIVQSLNDTVTRVLTETTNQTISKQLTDALNETVNRIVAETSNKTETLDATRTIGEFHKQKQIKVIKGKADSDTYE
jgi:hypothetical protein